MMRAAFRVDAAAAIGTGHVQRCLALAHALTALGTQIRFVTRDLGVDTAALIAARGFADSVTLPRPAGGPFASDPAIPHSAWAGVQQAQDMAETIAALGNWSLDWLIVDSYALDARWHDGVRASLGCRIAAIDELADRRLAPDLLIDQTCASDHRAKFAACLKDAPRILGGPRHALLGPAFAAAPRHALRKPLSSIGIFMGGADAGHYSATMLDALDAAGFAGAVEVVTTSANPNLERLRQRVAARPGTDLLIDLPDLAAFFARHDLQIGAGGGATWERCCIGAPTVLIIVASNQNTVAPLLAEAGAAALASAPTASAVAGQLRLLMNDPDHRRALGERARQIVDGAGAIRVALALHADRLHVRTATIHDAQQMFDWRNVEQTRAVSRDSRPLNRESHGAWLDRVLADPARKLFVGMIGGRPVGVIRFDFSGPARAEVSLYLDPALHGTGLGPHLLAAGEAAAGATTIDAAVLDDNLASQRMFARCGYRQATPGHWIKHRSPDTPGSTQRVAAQTPALS